MSGRSVKELFDEINGLSRWEKEDLVEALEEKLGVSVRLHYPCVLDDSVYK